MKRLKSDNMNGQEETEDYKVGMVFLILAFIVLIGAFMMRDVKSWRGARLVLIIFGVALTFLGGFTSFQKRGKEKMQKIKDVKEMSKEKLVEKFSMVFLVVAGTVAILLGLVNHTLWVTAGLIWIFWGLGYVKQKAYTKHLAVTLLIFGSIVASLGWYLMPNGATFRVLITTTGMAMLAGGVINLIAYAVWEVKRK
jgi:MFS family permease